MSEPRKSAIQTEARRRARAKAAEFRAREDKLEALAVDFFVARAAVENVDTELERDIAALRERAEAASERARSEADDSVQAMLALGVPRGEVAQRLGVAVKDVKARPRAAATDPDTEHASEVSSEDQAGE